MIAGVEGEEALVAMLPYSPKTLDVAVAESANASS